MIARRLLRAVLRAFGVAERPAAWLLLLGGFATFVGVLTNLIRTGEAKWATLLVAADLVVSGFSAVQSAEPDPDDSQDDQQCTGCSNMDIGLRPCPVHNPLDEGYGYCPHHGWFRTREAFEDHLIHHGDP